MIFNIELCSGVDTYGQSFSIECDGREKRVGLIPVSVRSYIERVAAQGWHSVNVYKTRLPKVKLCEDGHYKMARIGWQRCLGTYTTSTKTWEL